MYFLYVFYLLMPRPIFARPIWQDFGLDRAHWAKALWAWAQWARAQRPRAQWAQAFFAEADSTLRDVKAQKANQIRVH